MEMLWKHGPMSVAQLLEKYPEPKPHFNTVSTMVRSLEKKGFVDHKAEGVSYHYFAKVSEAEYGKGFIKNIIHRYMDNSYMSAVSMFVFRCFTMSYPLMSGSITSQITSAGLRAATPSSPASPVA